jgi:V/A-type H+-transporting ATPase subunit K
MTKSTKMTANTRTTAPKPRRGLTVSDPCLAESRFWHPCVELHNCGDMHKYASSKELKSQNLNMAVVDPQLAIAAALVMAGGLIGTGIAQQGIGAAGMGIIAEKPEKFGQVLFFFVIPETLWIIGFVLGVILLLNIL